VTHSAESTIELGGSSGALATPVRRRAEIEEKLVKKVPIAKESL